MKRALTFLSAVALAAGVYAADKLEAGTADSPNYYVLKAGRGTPFLAYSEDYLTTPSDIETRLHRTNDLTQANVWAVTPGSAEGTVNITAYGTTRGLMNFINADGAFYGSGAIATVVKPQDIYPVHQADGTVSLCINSEEGRGNVDGAIEYYTLDASNGSDFCGNWVPGDAGTNWSAYKLDVTNGIEAGLAAVKQAAYEEAAKALVDQYIGDFNSYIANVPHVAPELNVGIEALNNLVVTDNYADDVATIWNEAIGAANVALETVLDGQVVALKNLRRAAYGVTPYVGISTLETPEKYFGAVSFFDATAYFTLKSAGEGGYTVYNEATKTWIGTGCVPTTNEAEAQVFYPFLHVYGPYAGVALPQSAEKSGPGLNFQSREAGAVSYWSVNDEGSIWSLVVADEAKAKDVIEVYVAKLEPYVNSLPEMVANILTTAIAEIKALTYSETLGDEATAIVNKAITDANVALETVLDGQVVALKNLRRAAIGVTPYVGISTLETPEKYFGVASFIDVTADFTLKSASEGGYTVYNEATKTWISTGCVPTTNEAEAQVLYPFLHAQGAYVGIALPQSAEKSGLGLNFQSWETGAVSYWSVNDEGSIWSLVVVDDEAKANDVIDVNVAKLDPYVNSMPDMVADILTTAIAEIKALTYSETLGDEAAAIADKAIVDANELLATGMNGMKLTLKNLRQNKFISIADGIWVYDEYNVADETVFTFKAHAEGGYILYNEAANIYVGEAVSKGTETNISVAIEEAAAMPVYPFLCKGGNFAGIALALEADPTGSTEALNTNNDPSIFHTYRADDAGSIFALKVVAENPIKLQGIVGNVGERIGLNAVVEPANAIAPTISWMSSNPEVAAVDADGVVWFNAAGSAMVTAECQGHELSLPFVVKEVAANALNVFPVEAVGGVGHEFSLLALHEPENTTDKSVTWESSDPEVATVSEDGRVSLAALGSAKITARSGEHTAVCAVTVDETVGLTEMASTGVVIDVVEGGIVVRNVDAGESIAVYSVDGKVVNGAIAEGEETKLNLAAGIYIVKVSLATVAKVLVK